MKRLLACCVILGACDQGVPSTLGLDEPIRVVGGQFISGALPASNAATPTITNVSISSPIVLPGQAGKGIFGRGTSDASAIALRFDDLGTGYWVVPMGPEDNQFPGELTWQASSNFDPNAASSSGHHTLRFVAIDVNGNVGPQTTIDMCFEPPIPDNNATCDPSNSPPAAVLTLKWDVNSDLDLVVVGPGGAVTDPKHPSTILPDAGVFDPTAGKFDRDSLAGCIPDGRDQEDLVWQTAPPAGTTFDVYASLFDACGLPAASFVATFSTYAGDTPVAQQVAKGTFTQFDVSGGSTLGTYLFSVKF